MSHAFDDVISRRGARTQRAARIAHHLRRWGGWSLLLVSTVLVVVVVGGFVEAWGRPGSVWEGPWRWWTRMTGLAGDPIRPTTGALLVLAGGAWIAVAGLALLRRGLAFGGGIGAVARTTLDEAVRNKTVVVLLGLLLVALAAQPWGSFAAVDQPLRYRIQTFLSFSSIVGAVLLGGVAVLFAAYSVSGDLHERRTGDVFVKPLPRWHYLLGKWTGVVGLLLVATLTQACVTWGVTRLWLAQGPALDFVDATAVDQRVLTARRSVFPQLPGDEAEVAMRRLETLRREQPDYVRQRGERNLFNDLINQQRARQFEVGVGQALAFEFTGLAGARARALAIEDSLQARATELARRANELGYGIRPEQVGVGMMLPVAQELGLDLSPAILQLRYKLRGISTYGAAERSFALRANGRADSVVAPVDEVQVLDLPASVIDEEGRLLLEIYNYRPEDMFGDDIPASVRAGGQPLQLDPETGIQILFTAGDFGPNVMRAGAVMWVRLAFLAMLGVACGALLSFPVAASLSVCVWILAAAGVWLQDTVSYRVFNTDVEAVDTAFNTFLNTVVGGMAGLLGRYGMLPAGSMLVDGRYISFAALGNHAFWIGLVWGGVVFLTGAYLFGRKEIARVQV